MVKKILILDDEVFIRQSFVDFFEDQLWEAVEAESGEAALELLKTETIPAAIVDIRLGGMSGDEFIRKMLPVYKNMVFLICTGSPEYYMPPEFPETGRVCPRLFTKPVSDMMEIVDSINIIMQNIEEG